MIRIVMLSLLVLTMTSATCVGQKRGLAKLPMPPGKIKAAAPSSERFKKADAIFEPANKSYQADLQAWREGNDAADQKMNRKKVLGSFQKAAKMGHPRAMFYLGQIATFGRHVKEDPKTAFAWYRRSADAGDIEALEEVARRLEIGDGVASRPQQSKKVYRKVLEQLKKSNSPADQFRLAEIYLEDEFSLGAKPVEAEKILTKLAADGNDSARETLHELYYWGNEQVEKDLKRAFEYAKVSADEGHFWGIEAVAPMLMLGEGCQPDPKSGEAYYMKAHEAGSQLALLELAGIYFTGQSGKKDVDRGVELLRKAIAEGNEGALIALAEMYQNGKFVEADMGKAIELWELGKTQDSLESYRKLLQTYSKGKLKNEAKAKQAKLDLNAWYEKQGVPKQYRDFD